MKKYDGCSGGMSKNWRRVLGKNPPWEHCCDSHDNDYAKGGTETDRLLSDLRLKRCVENNGHPVWAFLMYHGVRIGGVPWLPFPWRWGFETKNYSYTKDNPESK